MKILNATIGKDKASDDPKAATNADFTIQNVKDIANGYAIEIKQIVHDNSSLTNTARWALQYTIGFLLILALHLRYGSIHGICSGTSLSNVALYTTNGDYVGDYYLY